MASNTTHQVMIPFSSRFGKEKLNFFHSLAPLVWWSIWKEQNEQIFGPELFRTITEEARSRDDAGRRRVLALAERPL